MAKEIFDYSKSTLSSFEYYGFHLKDGRYHIDTKRLIKLGYKWCFPKALFETPRNTHYFIPKYKYRHGWAINRLLDCVNELENDWNSEYKHVLNKIKTPEEVMEEDRLNELAFSSSSDDLDEINENATLAGIERMGKYNQVIKSIHLQYLQKIFVEFFRALLLVISKRGYSNDKDFTYKVFLEYVMERFKVEREKANPIYGLKHYKWFDVLNKIDNFIKHNTVSSYNSLANNAFEGEELKQFYSNFVYGPEEVKREYANGMYAGNWLKISDNLVDVMLKNIRAFAIELCELLYKEDADEAEWNSEEFLKERLKREVVCTLY